MDPPVRKTGRKKKKIDPDTTLDRKTEFWFRGIGSMWSKYKIVERINSVATNHRDQFGLEECYPSAKLLRKPEYIHDLTCCLYMARKYALLTKEFDTVVVIGEWLHQFVHEDYADLSVELRPATIMESLECPELAAYTTLIEAIWPLMVDLAKSARYPLWAPSVVTQLDMLYISLDRRNFDLAAVSNALHVLFSSIRQWQQVNVHQGRGLLKEWCLLCEHEELITPLLTVGKHYFDLERDLDAAVLLSPGLIQLQSVLTDIANKQTTPWNYAECASTDMQTTLTSALFEYVFSMDDETKVEHGRGEFKIAVSEIDSYEMRGSALELAVLHCDQVTRDVLEILDTDWDVYRNCEDVKAPEELHSTLHRYCHDRLSTMREQCPKGPFGATDRYKSYLWSFHLRDEALASIDFVERALEDESMMHTSMYYDAVQIIRDIIGFGESYCSQQCYVQLQECLKKVQGREYGGAAAAEDVIMEDG
jgi:hypothetical protein